MAKSRPRKGSGEVWEKVANDLLDKLPDPTARKTLVSLIVIGLKASYGAIQEQEAIMELVQKAEKL